MAVFSSWIPGSVKRRAGRAGPLPRCAPRVSWRSQAAILTLPRPSQDSTSCTCCRCRTGRDHCVRAWPLWSAPSSRGGRILCTGTCWATPHSTNCCSPVIATSPIAHGARVARGVAALFIPLRIGASRVAGPAASGVSTTGALASAARSMAVDRGRRRRRCASLAPRSTSPRSWC